MQGFGNGDQLAALTLHVSLFSPTPQTRPQGDAKKCPDHLHGCLPQGISKEAPAEGHASTTHDNLLLGYPGLVFFPHREK